MMIGTPSHFAFFNQAIIPFQDIRISPLDRGFIFGEGMYTTIACEDGVPLFLKSHLKRLENQIQTLSFPEVAIDFQYWIEALLARNNLKNAAIYIHITRGVDQKRDHMPQSSTPTVMMLAMPWSPPLEPGIATAMVATDPRWEQCHLKTISLLANVQATQNAHRTGYDKVIFERNGFITEAAQANIFIVKNNQIITPPTGPHLLSGVTRHVLIQAAKQHGWIAKEESIRVSDLLEASEVFLTASLSQIVSIRKIDDSVLEDEPKVAKLLFEWYEDQKELEKNHYEYRLEVAATESIC